MELLTELSDAEFAEVVEPGNTRSIMVVVVMVWWRGGGEGNVVVLMLGVETAAEVVILELAVVGGGEEVRERGLGLEFHGDAVPVVDAVTLHGAC